MRALGPYYGDSERFYVRERRQRAWSTGTQGLHGYAAYLSGEGDAIAESSVSPAASGVIAAELDAITNSGWLRPIVIGVATSAAAFIVNRWLARYFK